MPKKKSSPKKKSRRVSNPNAKKLFTGANVKWESSAEPEEEQQVSREQIYIGIGVLFVIFMFVLWAFVDDRPEWKRRAQEEENERRRNETMAKQKERESRNAALWSYNYANLLNSTQLSDELRLMQSGEDDRLMVVAFDDSTREESQGMVHKVRLFKKMDGIAKRIPKHKLFKRYEEEDIPKFTLFDCGSTEDSTAENVCRQIVGQSVPNVLVFRPSSQPRALPNDLKSDKDIMSYLYNLMQPAVKYLEELVDAEAFVSDDSELHCMLFTQSGTAEAIQVYDEVSDQLRDYGYFGRTRNPTVIESFDLDINQLPALLIWRTFGENPQMFSGNITSKEAIADFVMNNFVPVFGEFNPSTSKRFMKRGLPILWVAFNNKMADDALQLLLNSALSVAKRYRGQLTFVQLDVDAQPQIAQNFGFDVADSNKDGDDDDEDEDEDGNEDEDGSNALPQVLIMNQIAQIKERVNMDDIEGTVQNVIQEYMLQLRISRGQGPNDMMDGDMEYDDDDDEFEEDDDDDDDEEVDTLYDASSGQQDDDEEEEEEEEEGEESEAADGAKTDL